MGGAIAAAAAAAEGQPPQQQPQRSAAAAGRRLELSQELADATSSSATQPPSSLPQLAELGPPAAAACPAALEPLELPAGPAAPTGAGVAAVPRQQRGRWQHIEAALGAKLPSVLPALGAFQSLEGGAGALPSVSNAQQQLQGSKEQGAQRERPAPLSAVLELCVAQSVASQYRAVSRACVRWVVCGWCWGGGWFGEVGGLWCCWVRWWWWWSGSWGAGLAPHALSRVTVELWAGAPSQHAQHGLSVALILPTTPCPPSLSLVSNTLPAPALHRCTHGFNSNVLCCPG